jgi:ribosomal protein S18 acetylase RimI-like enzyme
MPMKAEEFAVYVKRAIPEHAQDKVSSGQWSSVSSLAQSRQEFEELLPQGLATRDNYLFTVRDVKTEEDIGMLWYATQDRAGQRVAYVYDILVEPQKQRRGFGTAIFRALEAKVAAQGLTGIELHVFGHNTAAHALYVKLGYRATNISMFKAVASAGT